MMFKKIRFWIGLAVTLGFLYLFLRKVNFSEIGDALRMANYIYILPALAAYFIGVWFRAVRWRYLLKPIHSTSSAKLFPVVVIGYMANNILPFRTGELVRAYIMGEKERLSKMSILGSIVVERIFDGLALLFFVAIVMLLPFIQLPDWLTHVARIMSIVFVGALAFFLLIALSERWTARTVRLLLRFLPGTAAQRAGDQVRLFIEGTRVLHSPVNLAAVFVLSILIWVAEASMYFIMTYSFNLHQPFYVILMSTAAANLFLTLPSSPGGIGPFEWATGETLKLFGTGAALATSYAVALHAVLLIPVSLLGFVFLWLANMSLAQVTKMQVTTGAPSEGGSQH